MHKIKLNFTVQNSIKDHINFMKQTHVIKTLIFWECENHCVNPVPCMYRSPGNYVRKMHEPNIYPTIEW